MLKSIQDQIHLNYPWQSNDGKILVDVINNPAIGNMWIELADDDGAGKTLISFRTHRAFCIYMASDAFNELFEVRHWIQSGFTRPTK